MAECPDCSGSPLCTTCGGENRLHPYHEEFLDVWQGLTPQVKLLIRRKAERVGMSLEESMKMGWPRLWEEVQRRATEV